MPMYVMTHPCVLFGDPQGDKYRYTRFENAPKFFNWGFENYSSVSVSELNLQSSFSVPVENGAFEDGGGLTATADVSGKIIAGTRDFVSGVISSKDTITPNVTYRDGAAALTAPIAAGDVDADGEEWGFDSELEDGTPVVIIFDSKDTDSRYDDVVVGLVSTGK